MMYLLKLSGILLSCWFDCSYLMPFTTEQFLEVFAAYNRAVFPMQLVLVSAALVAIFLAIRPNKISGKAVTTILACLWLWMGIVYHLVFFSSINRGAFAYGIFFIFQSLILFYAGVLNNKLSFGFHFGWRERLGSCLLFLPWSFIRYSECFSDIFIQDHRPLAFLVRRRFLPLGCCCGRIEKFRGTCCRFRSYGL